MTEQSGTRKEGDDLVIFYGDEEITVPRRISVLYPLYWDLMNILFPALVKSERIIWEEDDRIIG